jgi:hypothetical protein
MMLYNLKLCQKRHNTLQTDNISWHDEFLKQIFENSWSLTVIPTLLYTWQFSELVAQIANPERPKHQKWLTTSTVTFASVGTLTATVLYDYRITCERINHTRPVTTTTVGK